MNISRLIVFSRGNIILALCLVAISIVALVGCGGKRSGGISNETAPTGKMRMDAFLFDVKLRFKKQRRSFRLDLYATDTVALVTARGYVGKGVARGVWRSDSSFFYFPTENEYFSGSLDSMIKGDCWSFLGAQANFPLLMRGSRESLVEILGLTETSGKDKKIKGVLVRSQCETPLRVVYDRKGDGLYYLKEFEYRGDGELSRVVGKRRKLKQGAKIKKSRLSFTVPADAMLIRY